MLHVFTQGEKNALDKWVCGAQAGVDVWWMKREPQWRLVVDDALHLFKMRISAL